MLGSGAAFFRLVIGATDIHPGQSVGVFQGAYAALDDGNLPGPVCSSLRNTLNWFERNLRAPAVPQTAIFWFKGDGNECTRRVWDLAGFLRANNVPVRILKTREPGYIEYEDRFQIAAVPFRDRL